MPPPSESAVRKDYDFIVFFLAMVGLIAIVACCFWAGRLAYDRWIGDPLKNIEFNHNRIEEHRRSIHTLEHRQQELFSIFSKMKTRLDESQDAVSQPADSAE